MRLLDLFEDVVAYHGTDSEFDQFRATSDSTNSTVFGDEPVTRNGIFFTTNPRFASLYGKNVGKYSLNIRKVADLDLMGELLDPFLEHMSQMYQETNDPVYIETLRDAEYHWHHGNKWALFDDDVGHHFVRYLKAIGYDAATLDEEGDEVIVVFDPSAIQFIDHVEESLNESFFSDNADVLMPVVRGLMKTAARPLIYKLWKKSKNAVLALAAIQKLHDQGDPNPLDTLERISDLDVPIQFLRRLAWDAGMRDIPGIGRSKPGVLPHMAYKSL